MLPRASRCTSQDGLALFPSLQSPSATYLARRQHCVSRYSTYLPAIKNIRDAYAEIKDSGSKAPAAKKQSIWKLTRERPSTEKPIRGIPSTEKKRFWDAAAEVRAILAPVYDRRVESIRSTKKVIGVEIAGTAPTSVDPDPSEGFDNDLQAKFISLIPKAYRIRLKQRWIDLATASRRLASTIAKKEALIDSIQEHILSTERELTVAKITGDNLGSSKDPSMAAFARTEKQRREFRIQQQLVRKSILHVQQSRQYQEGLDEKYKRRDEASKALIDDLEHVASVTGGVDAEVWDCVRKIISNPRVGAIRKESFEDVQAVIDQLAAGSPDLEPVSNDSGLFSQTNREDRIKRILAAFDVPEAQLSKAQPSTNLVHDATSLDRVQSSDRDAAGLEIGVVFGNRVPHSMYYTCDEVPLERFYGRMIFTKNTAIRPSYAVYTKVINRRDSDVGSYHGDPWPPSPTSGMSAEAISKFRSPSATHRLLEFCGRKDPHRALHQELVRQHEELLTLWSSYVESVFPWRPEPVLNKDTLWACGHHDEIVNRPDTLAVYTDGGFFNEKSAKHTQHEPWASTKSTAAAVIPSHCSVVMAGVVSTGIQLGERSTNTELLGQVLGLQAAAQIAKPGQHVALFTDFLHQWDAEGEYARPPSKQDPLLLDFYDRLLASLELISQAGATASMYWLPKKYQLIPNKLAHTAVQELAKPAAVPVRFLEEQTWTVGLIRQAFHDARTQAYLSDVG